jgi:hypothetical protein
MPIDNRNNFDLSQLQKGDNILWNDRQESATVKNKMLPFSDHPDESMRKEALVTVKTQRGAEHQLRQSVKSGDTVRRVGSRGSPDPLRYVKVIKE